jgi:precorrin-6A/cobalt-precorrin-6A reductase
MKLLVLAGTEDGRKLASEFQKRGHQVLVSTLTEYGAEIAGSKGLRTRSGALEENQFKAMLKEQEIEALIDATHPYAENIRSLAQRVCQEGETPYYRWERPKGQYPSDPLIYLERDIESAARCACHLGKRIFLSTGSKNLKQWMDHLGLKKCEVFVRVLPTVQVLELCEEVGLKPYQIIAAQGPFTQKFNEALWEQLKIDVVVTKESGSVGGTDEKVQACLELKIPVIILERPENKEIVNSLGSNSMEDYVRKVEEDIEYRNNTFGAWKPSK